MDGTFSNQQSANTRRSQNKAPGNEDQRDRPLVGVSPSNRNREIEES
jgi:hypothetical protein